MQQLRFALWCRAHTVSSERTNWPLTVAIGADVEGVFRRHHDSDPPYSLLHWRVR
jgi:hypothetical protein